MGGGGGATVNLRSIMKFDTTTIVNLSDIVNHS